VRKRWIFILLCVAVAAGAVYVLEHRKARTYAAVAQVTFAQSALNLPGLLGLPAVNANSANQTTTLETEAEIAVAPDTAAAAAKQLHGRYSAQQILGDLGVAASATSNILTFTATDESSTAATAIVNAYVQAYANSQYLQYEQAIQTARQRLQLEIASVSKAGGPSQDLTALHQANAELVELAALQQSPAAVGLYAQDAPLAGPHPTRYAVIAGACALILALVIAVILARLDTRISSGEDLAAFFGTQLLGRLPSSRTSLAYRFLSANVTAPGPAAVRSLALSTSSGSAPVNTAAGLARACAAAGSRVIVVDLTSSGGAFITEFDAPRSRAAVAAAIYEPLLEEGDVDDGFAAEASPVQMSSSASTGLSEVVADAASLNDALVLVDVGTAPSTGTGSIGVLATGAWRIDDLPPLAFARVQEVLDELRDRADVLITVMPSVSASSAALLLLTPLDALIIEVAIGTNRRALVRARNVVQALKMSAAGVIAVGRE
jgi:capsular polysaccharide biosynthesis protein